MADPTPTPPPAAIVPFVSSFLALAKGRKGLVLIVLIVFATVVYLKDPTKLTQILAFLGVVAPAYFASQAYEDGKKQDAVGATGEYVVPSSGDESSRPGAGS